MALPVKPADVPEDLENPVRGEPRGTFAAKANEFLRRLVEDYTPALNDMADWINATAIEIESIASDVESDAISASASASAALTSRNQTEGFKDSAEAAAVAAQAGAGLPVMTQNGDVLTITDAGTNAVAFQTPSKGGLVPIQTVSFSAVSAIEITDLETLGYDNFKILLIVDVTVSSAIRARLSNDGGVSFRSGASDYAYLQNSMSSFGDNTTTGSNSDSYISAALAPTFERSDIIFDLGGLTDISSNSSITSGAPRWSTSLSYDFLSGVARTKFVDNAIQLYLASGTMTGKYTLYGVAEA